MSKVEIKYNNTGNKWMFVLASGWKNCQRSHRWGRNASKKVQSELTNAYLKEKPEYIQDQVNKIRRSIEDRKSRIVW